MPSRGKWPPGGRWPPDTFSTAQTCRLAPAPQLALQFPFICVTGEVEPPSPLQGPDKPSLPTRSCPMGRTIHNPSWPGANFEGVGLAGMAIVNGRFFPAPLTAKKPLPFFDPFFPIWIKKIFTLHNFGSKYNLSLGLQSRQGPNYLSTEGWSQGHKTPNIGSHTQIPFLPMLAFFLNAFLKAPDARPPESGGGIDGKGISQQISSPPAPSFFCQQRRIFTDAGFFYSVATLFIRFTNHNDAIQSCNQIHLNQASF